MTEKMIVPNSVEDGTATSREEISERSEFRQFEFWVNGVKRTIKVPLQSETETDLEASSKVTNVDPGDIQEVQSCLFSANPIIIDPHLNDDDDDDDDGALCNPFRREEVTNSAALDDSVGHLQYNQSTVLQNNESNASQNDISSGSVGPAKGSSRYDNRKPLTVRTELEKRRFYLPKANVATPVNQSRNQSITSQLRNELPVKELYVTNSQSQTRGLLAPSIVSKNIRQRAEDATKSKMPLVPSELVKSSKSNTPLNMSDADYKSLLQTVNSGIPVIMTNSVVQPLGRDGSPALPSTVSNNSVTYAVQPQWQLNKTTNCFSSNGAVQHGLTKQAASQSSLMFVNKQSHSLSQQPNCVQLRGTDSLANSGGANQSVNLSQFVVTSEQCYNPTACGSSVPISMDSSSAQVRKVKITTDINGSCIISVDGLSSFMAKPTNSSTSRILPTGGVLPSAVPFVIPNIFPVMHPNATQNHQTLQLVSSNRGTLHYMSSNALVNHRPISLESLKMLPNDKAFCLKPPNCEASCIPPLSFASQNAPLLGFEPSCTIQGGLAAQGRADGAQLMRGALCTGSVHASSASSLPVGMLPLCKLPSSMSVNGSGRPQPSVKCSSVASSACFSINSSAVLSKYSSSHPSSVLSEIQSSVSQTPLCLALAIPETGVNMQAVASCTWYPPTIYTQTSAATADKPSISIMAQNSSSTGNPGSIPSVKSTIDTTGSSYNKLNPQLREFNKRVHFLHVPLQPPVTVYSSSHKSVYSISAVQEISENLVVPPVRILFNKDQVVHPMAIISQSPPTAVSPAAGITMPSASCLVSSASAWETPTFPQWSRPTVSKSGDSLHPHKASMLSSSPVKAVASCTWYPPTIYTQTSSAMADKPSKSIVVQNCSSTGNPVSLFVPNEVFCTVAPTVSYRPYDDISSYLTSSVAQQPTQPLSTPRVTKSAFSFFNSHLKKTVQKPIPLFTDLPSSTSINSTVTSVCSTQNISKEKTDVVSSLIPISVEYYGSNNVSNKRKHNSDNSKRRNGSYNMSASSISDTINVLSDFEMSISSSESWTSDDSVTIGKGQTRRRKLTKRKAHESHKYSMPSVESSEVHKNKLELQCFVSLENLYLNGKTSVDIRDSSENLVCCRHPTQRPTSTVNSIGENRSRKKSYKLSAALNYLSDTD